VPRKGVFLGFLCKRNFFKPFKGKNQMAANLSQLFVGLFNAATGGYANQFKTSDANTLASVVGLVTGKSVASDADFVNNSLTNLGVPASGAIRDAAFAAVLGLVNSSGRGNAVLTAADYLANVAAKDATNQYYAVGTAFVAKVAVADAFTAANANESSVSALVSGTAGTGTGMTTATTDVLSGSSSNNIFSAIAASTGNTYDTGDMIVDSTTTDKDILNIAASIDVTAVPTITNIETINVNLDAITTTDTDFAFAATNIGSKTTFNFKNVAAVTAINSLTVTGLNASETVNVSSDFSIVSLAVGTNSITTSLAAAGTVGTPASLTIASAAKNVTATGAGYLNVTAATATGAINASAAKSLKIDATAAAAVIASSTGGNVTLTDVDSASLVNVTATGNITGAATALKDVKTLNLNSGGTLTATLATGSTLTSATLSGKGTTNSFTDTDGTLVEVSLSGNGGAATFNLPKGTTSVLNTVNISGSQNVTVKLDASAIEALTTTTGYDGTNDGLAVIDASTGTSTVKLQTAAGSANLSKSVGLDAVEIAIDEATETVTLPVNIPAVKISAAQAGATTLAMAAASKATNTLALTLDDGTKDGNAADFVAGSLIMTGIANATVDASVDTTAAGASNAHGFKTITGTDANTNVTINGGVNALNLAAVAGGAVNLGTGKLTVNGTGAVAVTHATGTLTASEFDASGKTAGVVTAVALSLAATPIFKTGAGADVITVATVQSGAATISTGDGNDTVKLKTTSLGAQNLTIDMGEGTGDKIVLLDTADLTPSTGKTVTISGVETIELDVTGAAVANTVAATVGAALVDGKTYKIQGNTTGNVSTITVALTDADTNVDLSTLVETTDTAKTIAATIWTMDASAKLAGYTLTGMSDAKNVLTGATGYQNTLIGGSKVDVLNAGSSTDTLTGGAGADTFDLTSAKGATATKFVTITDFVAEDADGVSVDTLTGTGSAGVLVTGDTPAGWTFSNGLIVKSGATLATFVTTASALAAGTSVGFAQGGDLYIYSTGATTAATDDVMVKLVGLGQIGVGIEDADGTAGYIVVA